MKKIIITIAFVFTAGVLASQTTKSSTQPTAANVQKNTFDFKKDLASAD